MSTQTAATLNERFAILDHVLFEETETGLVRILVNTPKAQAVLYTEGAHLTEWTAAGQKPGLFISPRSQFIENTAIRGGVPVIFPWFATYTLGEKKEGLTYPMHGFARTYIWTVESTHFSPDDDVRIMLSLSPNEVSKKLGWDRFRCELTFHIGETLKISLEVTNTGNQSFIFEDGFHTYFAVGDARQTTVEGLQGTTILDKMLDFKRREQHDKLLVFDKAVDQVHIHTAAPLTIHDNAWQRDIHVDKEGSGATVCWNPWSTLTPNFKDLASDSWEHFVCVEAINGMEDKVTLQPGASHTLACTISYKPQA